MILQIQTDPHAYLVTYSDMLIYFGSLLGFAIAQIIVILIFVSNKLSEMRKDFTEENTVLSNRVNGNEIKCQQALDISNDTQSMTLRFRQDYEKMIESFADKNTEEHEAIVKSLDKTAQSLVDLSELTRLLSKELGEHFGYHKGLKEQEEKAVRGRRK